LRAEAADLFYAAIAAVEPASLVARHLVRRTNDVRLADSEGTLWCWPAPTLVVGAGKAAAHMAAGCEQALGPENVLGEVVVADGCGTELQSIRVSEAGHPLPDERGEGAARRIIHRIKEHRTGGILCLISGGASSLLVCPRAPVTLSDKIHATQLLLACGADIVELNTVRKHLSEVKGGGLLRQAQAPMASLILSDVVGDDPGAIGSGPAVPDATTFTDAWSVIARYDLADRVPERVARLLKDGMAGALPDTVKPASPEAGRSHSLIVGSNRTALGGAARAARERGWRVSVHPQPLVGDTTEAALRFGASIREMLTTRTDGAPLCILAGGETTVRVRGTGRGGRNQEFALALAQSLAGADVVVLSVGTDGIDGPTDAAGAFVDGTTSSRARERGLSVDAALADNDAFTFFSTMGDLFRCGPTGTNVMDLKIVLLPPLPGSA